MIRLIIIGYLLWIISNTPVAQAHQFGLGIIWMLLVVDVIINAILKLIEIYQNDL